MEQQQRIHVALLLGGAAIAALIVFAVREIILNRQARVLTPAVYDLAPERVAELREQERKAQAVLDEQPDDFNAYVELALAREGLGDREGAAWAYREMNSRFPGNYLSWQNLGKLYEAVGQCDLAAEQYLRAIENAPRNPHLYRNIVNLFTYPCADRSIEIPEILERGLGVNPDSIDLLSMLAVYHRDHGDIERAIAIFEELLVHDQENEPVLNELKELKERRDHLNAE